MGVGCGEDDVIFDYIGRGESEDAFAQFRGDGVEVCGDEDDSCFAVFEVERANGDGIVCGGCTSSESFDVSSEGGVRRELKRAFGCAGLQRVGL